MDEARADHLGLEPIAADLKRIDELGQKSGLLPLIAKFQREGVSGLFGGFVLPDAKQSDHYIMTPQPGGHQPARQVLLRGRQVQADPRKVPETRRNDVSTRRDSFPERGRGPGHGGGDASSPPTTGIGSRTAIEPSPTTSRIARRSSRSAPGIDWSTWLTAYGVNEKDVAELIVRQPSFFTGLAKTLDQVSLDDWKLWLKWHLLHEAAPFLSKPFVDENFAFSGKVLTGAPENRPRWKRGVALVGDSLGEVLGKVYVSKHFPPAAKVRMKELVNNLVEAYRENITHLDWMGPETRQKALDKLAKFRPKIGYPDKWRDYSSLQIHRDDLVGNVRRATEFEVARNLSKLGKPVDRDEWLMTPQTVNAYYNAQMNEIVFPAAILQPPFFDMEADDAVNYGGIGAVIGHEIGHGFDDQGSKSDGDGNMVSWWTEADRKQFEARTKMLIDQYSGFEPIQLPGQKVNGALTIGENIGDLGGLSIAYKAYVRSLNGQPAPVLDKPDRRSAVLRGLGAGLAGQVSRCRAFAAGWPPTHTRPASSGATGCSAICLSFTRPSASSRATSSGFPPTSASGSGEDSTSQFGNRVGAIIS